jgi:hypothetical protein
MIRTVPCLLVLSFALPLAAEDITTNPAFASHGDHAADAEPQRIPPSWAAAPIVVQGGRAAALREEDRIGSYGQPRWTAIRRFAETRVYVVPEGKFEFEYWMILQDRKKGDKDGAATVKQVYEAEIGLPHRFQLDLYQVWEKEDSTGSNQLAETKFEVRWALADWGVIPGNPTLYAEWVSVSNGYDHAEGKILLGDEFGPRWHWGTNFVCEDELGGERERSLEMTNAISYTVSDSSFSVGAEDKFAFVDTKDDRGDYEKEVLVGPSIQVLPLPQMHINLSHLYGMTNESPVTKTVAVFGWEF